MKYQFVDIRTVITKGTEDSGLSFLEGEQDIPFKINRLYCIYEKDNKNYKGFHPNKHSWQLLFCPHGAIEVLIDDGIAKEKIVLDNPGKGFILHPGIWREIKWKQKDSVLCVAASGHYEPEKLRSDYELYTEFIKNNKLLEQNETSLFLGE